MPNNHAHSPGRNVVQKPRLRSLGSIGFQCYTISAENFEMNPNTTYPDISPSHAEQPGQTMAKVAQLNSRLVKGRSNYSESDACNTYQGKAAW